MSAPALTPFAEELHDALEPLAYDDASQGYALALYLAAVASMFDTLNGWVRDSPDGPGWSLLLDVDRAPTVALPWLAQFVGVQLLAGLDDAAQRERIRGTSGMRRGTVDALRAAAQQYLTGAKSVIVRERDGGAYQLTIITFVDETPDADAVRAALVAEKPAGLILDYHTLAGQDFELVREHELDFAAVEHDYANFDLLRGFRPGDLQWPEVGTYPDIDTYPGP